MAKKDLIIGAFKNYNFEQVKPWIKSINECGFKGDKVVIALNASTETVKKIEDEGFTVIQPSGTNMMVHMERFLHIHTYLLHNHQNYRYVITTDVRDVVFQTNPSHYLDSVLYDYSGPYIVASSEAIRIKHEKWNYDNIKTCFGQYFVDQVSERPVYNVGTLAGYSEHIRDLCAMLYHMSSNRADWVADQAAYNIILSLEPYNDGKYTHWSNLAEGWTCNLHVTNKPDQLEQFGPYLLEPRPVFKDDQIVTGATGEPYCIVHQYDRVPEWKKFFEGKYHVENLITFRTE